MPKQLDIKDAFETVHGLPRAKWKLLRERICQLTGKERPRDSDWLALQRHWLKLVAKVAGPNFGTAESDRFMLMTREAQENQWILELAEQSQQKVMAALGERPGERVLGKIPILLFMGEALYQQHARYWSEDGKPGVSDGCCIRDHGEMHIALPALRETRTVLPHELVHAHLGGLMLPTWLDEGVAQMVARRFKWDASDQLGSHAKIYWRTRGMEKLWSGQAFSMPQTREEQIFAYVFTEMLAKEIKRANEEAFREFLAKAHAEDAGERACVEVYGFGLADWVSRLIGDGDWTPSGGGGEAEEVVELTEEDEE